MTLAQSGDVTALQGITQISDTLIGAIRGYWSSSATGADEIAQIKRDLTVLAGSRPDETGLRPSVDSAIAEIRLDRAVALIALTALLNVGLEALLRRLRLSMAPQRAEPLEEQEAGR